MNEKYESVVELIKSMDLSEEQKRGQIDYINQQRPFRERLVKRSKQKHENRDQSI